MEVGKLCIPGCAPRPRAYLEETTFIVLGSGVESTGVYHYGLAPYGGLGDVERMERKIAQYPPGTKFLFDTRFHSERIVQHTVDTLGAWMSAHGYTLSLYREASVRSGEMPWRRPADEGSRFAIASWTVLVRDERG